MLSIFSRACWPYISFLWKNVYSGPLPIFWSDFFYAVVWALKYILYINFLIYVWFANIFSHLLGCLFFLLMVSFGASGFLFHFTDLFVHFVPKPTIFIAIFGICWDKLLLLILMSWLFLAFYSSIYIHFAVSLVSSTKVKVIRILIQFGSVPQSCPTLRPQGLQHARLPCPLPTAEAYSNSCPVFRWHHIPGWQNDHVKIQLAVNVKVYF